MVLLGTRVTFVLIHYHNSTISSHRSKASTQLSTTSPHFSITKSASSMLDPSTSSASGVPNNIEPNKCWHCNLNNTSTAVTCERCKGVVLPTHNSKDDTSISWNTFWIYRNDPPVAKAAVIQSWKMAMDAANGSEWIAISATNSAPMTKDEETTVIRRWKDGTMHFSVQKGMHPTIVRHSNVPECLQLALDYAEIEYAHI